MSTSTRDADSTERTIAGHYELLRELGCGSFGRTYLARDRIGDRQVAIKVLERRGPGDFKARELFEREGTVLRSLRHHGIPEVYDLFSDAWDGGRAAFLVMEYVDGVSLAEVIDEQRQLDPADVMHVFLELLGILDYLHGRVPPVLHRDIKPANIILRPDGAPALVDFGSVRRVFLGPDEAASTVVGTYGYMPYEQYMGQASPASDLYALGATFLHLLTGRPPREFMNADGRIEVPDPLPGDPRLTSVLARMLRPSPTERFGTAREVRQALLSPAESTALRTRGTGLPGRFLEPAIAALPPAPRAIEGSTAELLERVAPSAWELMDTSAKRAAEVRVGDVFALVFFSVITAGVLPVVFLTKSRLWRRRLRRYFSEGIPATAEILSIRLEKIPFEQHLARVSYEFEADGRVHRDVDRVLPSVADRWQPGDRVQILYIPGRDYDSIVVH